MTTSASSFDPCAYRIAVRTAVVAAAFSAVVAALLIHDYCRRAMKDPGQTPYHEALHTARKQLPDDAAIKEEITRLDQESRREYFRQLNFSVAGGALLCAGIIVTLAAWKWALTLGRRHPVPRPADREDWEAGWTPAARWTVGGLFVILLGGAAWLSMPVAEPVPPDSASGRLASAAGTAPEQKTGDAARSAPQTSATSPDSTTAKPTGTAVAKPTAEKPVEAVTKVPDAGTPVAPGPADKPTATRPAVSAEELARAWPCFRGRDGSGISPHANIPDDWDGPSGKNIVWKSPVPLIGFSSPIIVLDRIYFTGADTKKRQVFCYDAKTGKLLWQRDAPTTPEGGKELKLNEETGYASSTMATDGRYVAAIFANGDLAAFDLDGNPAWSKGLGIPENPYGHAASLTVYKNLLIIPFDQASARAARSRLYALDIATGRPVWEQARAVPSSWATPIVIRAANRDQLVTAASPWIIAYDPADGKELWKVKGHQGDIAPSPVALNGGVLVAANDSSPAIAIRADGSGDVTATHVSWQAEDNTPDICSPLATGEFAFLLTSEGMLTCYDAKNGEKLWEEDLGEFKCKASPSLVGKQLFVFGESGKCWILLPDRAGAKRIRQTDLGEGCVTCPAFQDGRMYVRGKKNLFCIGRK